MARLIINKHFAEHNEAANGFSNVDGNEDYVFGEIIICNDKENPSIYIKDIDNNSIGIGNVRIVDNDKILSKTDGGKLQTSIKMAWDGVNNQIKLFGTDEETPISTIDANNIIETIDRTIEVTAVKFGYEDVPNGLTANQDYIKITSFIDNKENIQYLPYVKEENEISISGDGIVVVSKDMDGVKISHSTVDVVYPEETELGFGKGQYISGVNVNEFGHVTEIKTATLPIPNTTLEKVIDKENGIDAQEGYYVYDVKPDGDGLKYKVEYAQLPSTVIYDEDITPEQKEKTGTFISEIKVEGDVVSYKKSDVNLDNYYTKAEAEKAFIDSSELDQKLKNMGLTEDGKLPEIAITINKDEVGDGKYISDIEVSTIDKTHLTLKTTSLGLDKFIDKESVVSNNAELSWGETTTIAAIGNKELKVSLPSKPGVVIGVSEENTTDSTYVLVGVNESAEETNEIVFEKMDFDINSVLTNKKVETNDNILSWGTAVSVATVGDKDIKVKLPETVISINSTEEKKGVSVITNISVDENDPTQLNVNYEDLIPKDVVTTEDLNGYATEDFVTGQGYLVSDDLNGYATEDFVTGQGYLKSDDLNGYATQNWVTNTALADNATQTWVENKGYLTEVPSGYLKSGDLNGYATQEWVTNTALTDNATKTWVKEQDYLTEVPNGYLKTGDLNGYATQTWVTNTALADNATQTWVENKGYLTEVPSEYVKEGELNNKFAEKEHNHVSSVITDSISDKSKVTATASELVQGKAVYDFVIGQGYLKSGDLSGYAKESWVSEQIANAVIGGVIDLSGYATTEYVNKTFIKNGDLVNYATKTWVENEGYLKSSDLNGYATEEFVTSQGYLKSGDLDLYATKTWVTNTALADNATQTWVKNQGYLTQTSLNGYIKSSDIEGKFANKTHDHVSSEITDSINNKTGITTTASELVQGKAVYDFVTGQGYLKSDSLNGYATQNWVTGTALANYATKDFVTGQGYLTQTSLNGYVKSSDIEGKFANKTHDHVSSEITDSIDNKTGVTSTAVQLTQGKAVYDFVTGQGYLKSSDLNGYATQTWVTNTALADNATQTWVKNQGYLTQTSLNGYVKSSDIEGKFAEKEHDHVSSEITDSIDIKSKITSTATELVQGKAVYDFVDNKLSGYIKKGEETKYTLPIAKEEALGGIKTGYSTNDKNYAVEVDANGNAYVNVPWVEVKDYLPNDKAVPSNLHYDPTATTNTYTADSGKYISGIKYDDKHHVTGINQSTLPETKYESSTFITIKDKVVSANTGDTSSTLARGDHNHSGVYQPVGEYVETSDLKTLTFNAGTFTSTSFKANADTTVNIPTSTTHLTNDSNWITSGDISITVQGKNGLTGGGTIGNGGTATISHVENSLTTGSSSTTLKHGDSFDVDYPTMDNYGHVTKLSTIKYNLPNVTLDNIGAAAKDHDHNDLYYTESEINTKLEGKSNTGHTHSSYENQHAFSHVVVGNTTISADNATDTLTLVAGDNVVLTPDATNDKVTIELTGVSKSGHNHDDIYYTESEVDAKINAITAASLGLGAALKYCGITTTELTDGATATTVTINNANHTAEAGCVVFYNDKEFVFNGSKWELLGAEVTYKVVQSAVADPTANGKSLVFIDTISQDANGVITATKKNVRSATTALTGVVKLVTGDMNGNAHVDGQAPSLDHYHSQYSETGHTHSSYVNQNAFSNVKVGETTISANSVTDTFTLVAGANVTITPDDTNDTITIAATDTVYTLSNATTGNTGGVQLVEGDMNGNAHVDGQAPSLNHSHSQYLPLSGGTMTGDLIIVNGVVSGATAYYQTSDERLKTFGDDIEIDFDKLKSIPKKYFTWKDDRKEGVDLGTSAQAVKELYPEIVSGDETLSVDYAKLSVIALKAIDKLHEENEMLRTELAMIKKHLGL